jgi:hypothetical protein
MRRLLCVLLLTAIPGGTPLLAAKKVILHLMAGAAAGSFVI